MKCAEMVLNPNQHTTGFVMQDYGSYNKDNTSLVQEKEYPEKLFYSAGEKAQGIFSSFLAYTGNISSVKGVMVMANEKQEEGITMTENLKILDSILELQDNWNQHGAEHFSEDHIDFIRDIIKQLYPQPMIFPTAAKSIHLEYDKNDNEMLILDIKKNRSILLFIKKNKRSKEKYVSLQDALKAVSAFNGQ